MKVSTFMPKLHSDAREKGTPRPLWTYRTARREEAKTRYRAKKRELAALKKRIAS